jgi:stage V sporulation protein K
MEDPFEGYGQPKIQKPETHISSPKTTDDPFESYPIPDLQQPSKLERSENEGNLSESQTDHTIAHETIMPPSLPDDDIDNLLKELDDLIGLKRVKDEVHRLLLFVKVQELRRHHNISNTRMSLHSVFYGKPGTGKTTVARLYGRMLHAMGLLTKGHLIETDRSGLIGKYVGQTAVKTDEKINEAMGGILFIDEAYSLSKGENTEWDYGSEAVEILMKRMEDHRDNLVVIAAGYPEPMQKFLNSNEGLRSRFSTYINFDDYIPSEMLEIFKLFCKQENYEIEEEAIDLVMASINYNYANRDSTFGNARFVRNLFETIIRNQALRIGSTQKSPTISQLKKILSEDVPLIISTDVDPISS